MKKIYIKKFHVLATNHYSSYICDLFIKLAKLKKKKLLMSTIIKDKTINLLMNNTSGNIIVNKLMNSLKNKVEGNTSKKNHIPLSLNNVHSYTLKNKNEDEKSQ